MKIACLDNVSKFKVLIRYCLMGGMVNGVGYLIFLMFLWKGIGHKSTATVLYVCGVLVSFWGNRTYVFNGEISTGLALKRLLLTLIIGYLINLSGLYLFVDVWGFSPKLIQLVLIAFMSIYFYYVNKFYVHEYDESN